MSQVIACNGVVKTFKATAGAPEQQVLKGLDLAVAAGERIAIVGPSGCGKSTLLNLIGALDRPTAGQLIIADQDIGSLDDGAITSLRNTRIGFVFQDHHLLPQATVLENVLLPCLAASGTATEAQRQHGAELLAKVGLGDRGGDWPTNLSGGQRQRVALARSLVMQPAVLLADEPTGALDETTAEAMIDLLLEVQEHAGTALVVVTHSAEVAARMTTTYTLRDGVLHTDGVE